MNTHVKRIEEPPGLAQAVEGNHTEDDSDVILARSYVFEVVLKRAQRKSIRSLDNDPKLLAVVEVLESVPIERYRLHPMFCTIRSTEDRLVVRNYLHYKDLANKIVEKLRGPQGEVLRMEYQSHLRMGEGI